MFKQAVDENKLAIQAIFKQAVNEGEEDEEDEKIKRFKNFFDNEMLLGDSKDAKESLEIFKKFLAGELQGKFVRKAFGNIIIVSKIKNKESYVKDWSNKDHALFLLVNDTENNKLRVIYNFSSVLIEK